MGPLLYWSRGSVLLAEGVTLGCVFTLLSLGPRVFPRFELPRLDILRVLAKHAWAAPASVALSVVALRAALLRWYPIPQPMVHDELSLMLGAQTFAEGRLTNPAHPLWRFFETFHVQQQPTYNSIYPPAQAMLLAIGIWLGHPWVAVLAASALMCAAVSWMLRAWFSPMWSLCGGVLLLFQVGLMSYWTNSYWGGSLAALAGAVLVGAAGRIWSTAEVRPRYAFVAAAAAAVLLNRRPFEGALVVAGVTAATIYWLRKQGSRPLRRQFLRLAIPVIAVCIPSVAAIGYYNFRVTGSPWMMPYVKGIQTYGVARQDILVEAAPVPVYRNPEFREFYTKVELDHYLERRNKPVASLAVPLFLLWAFFFGPALTIPLLLAPTLWKDRQLRIILLILAGCLAVNLTETWLLPHYLGPELPLLWIVAVAGLRWLYTHRRTAWRNCAVAAMAAVIAGNTAPLVADIAAGHHPDFSWARARVASRLAPLPGKQLVIVQYLPGHSVQQEFVYNDPDIDASHIVWARSLGADQDRALLNYYHGRHVWLLRVGATVESFQEIGPATGAILATPLNTSQSP
jgi:hypothetical protein